MDASVQAVRDVSKRKHQLTDCVEMFVRPEKLSQEDAWFCPQCRGFKCATKKLDIWKLPKILVIHLKRFFYTSSLRNKITDFVSYPLKQLRVSCMSQPMACPSYALFGVVVSSFPHSRSFICPSGAL